MVAAFYFALTHDGGVSIADESSVGQAQLGSSSSERSYSLDLLPTVRVVLQTRSSGDRTREEVNCCSWSTAEHHSAGTVFMVSPHIRL